MSELRGALGTYAEDLHGVLHLAETVLGADRRSPALHLRAFDLDGAAAPAAYEVMVMPGAAAAIDRLTVGCAQHVELTVGGHRLQDAVHGCQADGLAAVPERGVQLLGRDEILLVPQLVGDSDLLTRRPAGRLLACHSDHIPALTTASATASSSTEARIIRSIGWMRGQAR